MTFTAAPNPTAAGESLTYTVRVTNIGVIDLHATVVVRLPDPVTLNGQRVWTPTIPVGGAVWMETVTVVVDANYTGPLTQSVEITTAEGVTAHQTVTTLAAGEVFLIEPTLGGAITITSPDGAVIQIEAPAGAVTDPLQLGYTGVTTAPQPPDGLTFAGRAFRLEPYRNGQAVQGQVFQKPITVTIGYLESDVDGLDEETLELRCWRGAGWSDEGIETVARTPTDNWLVTTISHLSTFAMFARPPQTPSNTIYLPLVLR
jgi:uncharacterized repeat protein (TIGR01451 family)